MRAAVIEQGSFVVREVEDPVAEAGHLVLRVAAVGICGSDLKMAPYMPDGSVMGHEFVGEVVAAGPDVSDAWPLGTAAVALPVIACGTCRDCRAGDPARCPQAQLLGVGGGPGAFAELVRVSAAESCAFGDAVPLETGALVEPMAVGLHAVNRAHLSPEDRLLVIGAGPVGLAVTLWAERMGVREIVVSDPAVGRRQAAADLGATAVLDPATAELDGPYDVVVECVGSKGMVATTIDALRPRGRAVIAGVCLEEDPFMPVLAVTKDVDLAFASYYTREEFALTARLLGSGRFDVGGLVTERVPLEELPEVVDRLRTPQQQRKVLVVP